MTLQGTSLSTSTPYPGHTFFKHADMDRVPIYEIWLQATRSDVAATVFIVMLLLIACFALNACVETSSRLTWAFARDNALLGSPFLGAVHPHWKVPVWALVANSAVIAIIGFVYLGSSTAFHAFIGSGLLLQQCSYAFPAALLLWYGRLESALPKTRAVNLGFFGWVANVITFLFAPFITIMYCFPVSLPVSGSTMSKWFNFILDCADSCRLYMCCNWGYVPLRHVELVSLC